MEKLSLELKLLVSLILSEVCKKMVGMRQIGFIGRIKGGQVKSVLGF